MNPLSLCCSVLQCVAVCCSVFILYSHEVFLLYLPYRIEKTENGYVYFVLNLIYYCLCIHPRGKPKKGRKREGGESWLFSQSVTSMRSWPMDWRERYVCTSVDFYTEAVAVCFNKVHSGEAGSSPLFCGVLQFLVVFCSLFFCVAVLQCCNIIGWGPAVFTQARVSQIKDVQKEIRFFFWRDFPPFLFLLFPFSLPLFF